MKMTFVNFFLKQLQTIMKQCSDSVATHIDDSPQLSPVPFTDPGESPSEPVTGWPRRNIRPPERLTLVIRFYISFL